MQKVIDQITDQLVTLVTNEKEVYNPKDLLKSGIPSFVVERIRLLLEDKVKEEIGIGTPKWFDAEERLVSDARNDFINSAISSSHIPKEFLYEVINTVIKGIIFVFVEPRKNMAEYIFRDNDELSFYEIEERCSYLTIYKHFGTAIPLYMKKRKLDSLTKDRCQVLIQKLDAKLVASYTAEDWAQKLEQLFILFGGKVDPILLSTFFEDKGLYGMAGKFENLSDSITKSDFINLISTEDLESLSSESKNDKSTKKVEKTTKKEKKAHDKDELEHTLLEEFFGSYGKAEHDESNTLVGQFAEGSLTDDEMSELLSDIAGDGVIEVDGYEQVDSLNKLFLLSGTDDEDQVSETTEEIAAKMRIHNEDDAEEIIEFRENLISILDQAKYSFENIDKKGDSEVEEIQEDIVQKDTVEPEEIISDEKGEGKPIWAKFLSEDQMDVVMGGERNKQKKSVSPTDDESLDQNSEIEIEDSYSEDPFIDDAPADLNTSNNSLENRLEDRKSEFIEIIFNGSTDEYQKSIEKIEQFKTWKETSTFIQKKLFAKNDVDMFAGATVDFTDRLHQYFNEQPNS